MNDLRSGRLDRFTEISELGEVMRTLLRPGIVVIMILVSLMSGKLFFSGISGAQGLLWMGVGTCLALAIWRSNGVGLPLLPMFAIQHLAVYGMPIFSRNETIITYPDELISQCGIEIFIFLLATALAWRAGMHFFTSRRSFCYMLRIFSTGGSRTLRMFATGLVIGTTCHEFLSSLGLLQTFYDFLPNGSYSIVTAIVNSAAMSGFFLLAMSIGTGEANIATKSIFWICLISTCLLLAASFLLSSTTNVVGAVTIGLFWGAGRMPWRFLGVTMMLLSFFHLGKFEMRERYWQQGDDAAIQNIRLIDIVPHYLEWFDASYTVLTADETEKTERKDKGKSTENNSMLNRVNNLQNLLFVIDAVENKKMPTLNGSTYTLIPPLLIPRILWAEKPRTHEGQVMLNVHFGRQDLRSTFQTYVAWGLVPEAYGNFGSLWGSVILGVFCGVIFAKIETATVYKPLLSLEGLLTFAFFIGLAVSFEMVASVLVTSLFQSVMTIVIACIPFVHKTFMVRPDEDAGIEEIEEVTE